MVINPGVDLPVDCGYPDGTLVVAILGYERSADEPMHGQDLYMLIQLLDVPHDANAGWCKFVNFPFGIGADYVFFNVGA